MQIAEKVSHDGVTTTGEGDNAVSEMSTRMELVGRVAAGLAHDLNGPVGVVLGFTQLAREKLESDDAAAQNGVVEYLKMIESAGENARSLARDMWEFAKTASGEVVEFDLAELLEISARLIAPLLRVAAIEPPKVGEMSSQMVTGDRAMKNCLSSRGPLNGTSAASSPRCDSSSSQWPTPGSIAMLAYLEDTGRLKSGKASESEF